MRRPSKLHVALVLTAATILLLAGFPVRLSAADQPLNLSSNVRLDDLDVSSDSGRRIARNRIQQLAQRLCNDLGERSSPSLYDFADCARVASTEPLRQLARMVTRLASRQVADAGEH